LIVLNGDIITDLDLDRAVAFYKKKKARVVLVLAPVDDPTQYGLVLTDKNGRVTRFLEKPSRAEATSNNINAGTYIMDPAVFDHWTESREFSFERELFPRLLARDVPVYGFVDRGYWMDLGSPAKYLQTHFDALSGRVSLTPAGTKKKKGLWQGKKVVLKNGARQIKGPAVLGDGCRLENGARLGPLVTLGRQVLVGEKSRVEKSVILDQTQLGQGVLVKNSIIGKNVRVGDGVIVKNAVVAHDSILKKGTVVTGELQ
jgi:mannose-1-phosphate guanylyltransferase / phosphomannomutase